MDIRSLIFLFSGVVIELVCGNSSAKVSRHPTVTDTIDVRNHGTQYRFQYFVRDERGDYKTQEESGGGGNARGSYAVEEPDGDLRIVQYTADIGGGFKAHIKVDHGDKSPPKLEEIDIPAEEMRKIIENNRKKMSTRYSSSSMLETDENQSIDESSKSYMLGPPKKMSDIVMEQAAAIREIISKEIEAEEKREAEENKKNNEKIVKIVKNATSDISKDETANDTVEVLKNSKIFNKNNSQKNSPIKETEQSPVVRVVPLQNAAARNIESSEKSSDDNSEFDKNREISGPVEGPPVRNFSFKNRIMFYKPSEKKTDQTGQNLSKKNIGNNDSESSKNHADQEEILLYSPYGDERDNKEDNRKSRYIAVPYAILRPYLRDFENQDEKNA